MYRQTLASLPRATVLVTVVTASSVVTPPRHPTKCQKERYQDTGNSNLGIEKQNLLFQTSSSWMASGGSVHGQFGGSMYPKHVMGTFHHLFPLRQLWRPSLEYPLWDDNWDGRETSTSPSRVASDRPTSTVRHLILIPQGQVDQLEDLDEENDEDCPEDMPHLTALGQQQANSTGEHLANLLERASSGATSVNISYATSAKETAEILLRYLQNASVAPDSRLKEGRPCHTIPGTQVYHIQIQAVDQQHPRIEQAFRTYFHRPDPVEDEEQRKNEVEIVVAHPNVLRYFLCRALQLPPEVYTRYSLGECSISYLIIGANGGVIARTIGDLAHLSKLSSKSNEFLW